jgi:hypothetical protein
MPSYKPRLADKLILTKIDGRFVFMGAPRFSPNEPNFYILADDREVGKMTFLQCRVRLPDYVCAHQALRSSNAKACHVAAMGSSRPEISHD